MDDYTPIWSLEDAFPWLGRWIERGLRDNSLSEQSSWGSIIGQPVYEVSETVIRRLEELTAGYPPNLEIGAIFPYAPKSRDIEDLQLSVRSLNCLQRSQIKTVSDLQKLTMGGLLDIRNLGLGSRVEIFKVLFQLNLRSALESWPVGKIDVTRAVTGTPDVSPDVARLLENAERQNGLIKSLKYLASWSTVSQQVDGFQLINIESAILTSDQASDLGAAIETLKKYVDALSAEASPTFVSLSNSDAATQDVIMLRICGEKKLSLQELGDIHNVSRERIRQLEAASKKAYAMVLAEDPRASYLSRYLHESVRKLECYDIVSAAFPATSSYPELGGLTDFDIVIGFSPALYLFDGLISRFDKEALVGELNKISRSDKEVGLHLKDSLIEKLDQTFGNGVAAFKFGLEAGAFSLSGDFVIPARVGLTDLTELLLAATRTQMAFDELSEILLGSRSEKSFRNALFSDERFARTSLTHWALSVWKVDTYTTIKDEIREVLELVDSIPVDRLVHELTTKYGVSASSVISYAASWPFQTIAGLVTLTDTAEVSYGQPLPNNKDIFNVHGDLMIRIKYGTEQVRGSGTGISKAAASFLGILHGESRNYYFHDADASLKVSFSGLQPTLGSLRELANFVHAVEGDQLFLRLGARSEIFKRSGQHQLKINDVEEFLKRKLSDSPSSEIRATFADLISLEEGETLPTIFSTLRKRGEFELENQLRKRLGENEAFDYDVNLKNESKFKIVSIDNL